MLLFSLKRAFHYLPFANKRINISQCSYRLYTTDAASQAKNWKITEPYFNLGQVYETCKSFTKNEIGPEQLTKAFNRVSQNTFHGINSELARFISKIMKENFNSSMFNALKIFEETVARSLKYYSDNQDIDMCLQNINSMHKVGNTSKNENIEADLLDYLSRTRDTLRNIRKINTITRLIQTPSDVAKYTKIYEALARNIRRRDLENFQGPSFFTIANVFYFANYYLNEDLELKTQEGDNLLDILQREFMHKLMKGEAPVNQVCSYLKFLQLRNNKYIESQRELEPFLLENIKRIEDSYYATFLQCISKLHDEQSENDPIYQKVYEDFLERFPFISTDSVIVVIKQLNEQYRYFDDRLCQLMKEKIENPEFSKLKASEKIDLCIEYLSCLWVNYENYDTELAERLKNIIFENYEDCNDIQKTRAALFYSFTQDYNEKFWRLFLDDAIILSANKSALSYFYLIHESLYGTPYYNEFDNRIEPYIEEIKSSWRFSRDKDLKKIKSTHTHEVINNYFISKRIDFQRDYYCHYYFDFANPLSKKLIKVNNMSNHVLPSKFLKRYYVASKSMFEMKGWKVLNIRSFGITDEEIIGELEKFLANK